MAVGTRTRQEGTETWCSWEHGVGERRGGRGWWVEGEPVEARGALRACPPSERGQK